MISKAQDTKNHIFILSGVLNAYFNECLRFYVEKIAKVEIISKKTKNKIEPHVQNHSKKLLAMPKFDFQHYFKRNVLYMLLDFHNFPFLYFYTIYIHSISFWVVCHEIGARERADFVAGVMPSGAHPVEGLQPLPSELRDALCGGFRAKKGTLNTCTTRLSQNGYGPLKTTFCLVCNPSQIYFLYIREGWITFFK